MQTAEAGLIGWERALMAAEKVQRRLRRRPKAPSTTPACPLCRSRQATPSRVGRQGRRGAVRNTETFDLLLRRIDLAVARTAARSSRVCVHIKLLDAGYVP